MIKRIIILLLLLLSFSSYAQKDSNKSSRPYMSVSVGRGIPTNNFYIDAPGGVGGFGSYATNGCALNISGGVPISHTHFGFTGLLSYNVEPFDVNQCFLDLCERGNDNQLISDSYSDFREILLMGGVFFSLGKKSVFNFRLMAGDNFCMLAGYSLIGATTTTSLRRNITSYITSSMQSANSSAMGYDLGIDCRFLQRKHIIGLVSCDFMYSQSYVNTTYSNTDSSEFNWLIGCDHFRVNYNLLCFTAGVGYKF